jgi:hypothetical protein
MAWSSRRGLRQGYDALMHLLPLRASPYICRIAYKTRAGLRGLSALGATHPMSAGNNLRLSTLKMTGAGERLRGELRFDPSKGMIAISR